MVPVRAIAGACILGDSSRVGESVRLSRGLDLGSWGEPAVLVGRSHWRKGGGGRPKLELSAAQLKLQPKFPGCGEPEMGLYWVWESDVLTFETEFCAYSISKPLYLVRWDRKLGCGSAGGSGSRSGSRTRMTHVAASVFESYRRVLTRRIPMARSIRENRRHWRELLLRDRRGVRDGAVLRPPRPLLAPRCSPPG